MNPKSSPEAETKIKDLPEWQLLQATQNQKPEEVKTLLETPGIQKSRWKNAILIAAMAPEAEKPKGTPFNQTLQILLASYKTPELEKIEQNSEDPNEEFFREILRTEIQNRKVRQIKNQKAAAKIQNTQPEIEP